MVSLVNVTRGGSDFLVGDLWRVDVNGPPNQPVVNHAVKDGIDLGSTQYGYTDGSGNFVLTGSMAGVDVGHWTETWSVGGVDATPTLMFTVAEGCSVFAWAVPPIMYSTDNYDVQDGSYRYTWPYGASLVTGTVLNPPNCFVTYSEFSPWGPSIVAQRIFTSAYSHEWAATDAGPIRPNEPPRCFNCSYPYLEWGDFNFIAVDLLLNFYWYQAPILLVVDRDVY